MATKYPIPSDPSAHEAYLARRRAANPYLARLQDGMRSTGLTHAELRQRGLLPDPEKETDADD